MKAKVLIPGFITIAGFTAVMFILWEQEFRHYLAIQDQSELELNTKLELEFLPESKPAYLHFFSEDCRQAIINIEHINQIAAQYPEEVSFFIINNSRVEANELKTKYNLHHKLEVIQDPKGTIAQKLNVSSTPYALISSDDQHLFFGGNYNNKNGLCGAGDIIWSSPAVALRALMKNQQPPWFPSYQLDFRGCGT